MLETFELDDIDEIVEITVEGEVIQSTTGHPFWVIEGNDLDRRPWPEHLAGTIAPHTIVPGRWVDAGDLQLGDVVLLKDRKPARVVSLTIRPYEGLVYNFSVDDLQCYAVGLSQVLVHNRCGDDLLSNKGTTRYHQVVNKENRIRNQIAAGGNRGVSGTLNRAEANFLGERFVGSNFSERMGANGERILISKDGLRQYRSPTSKDSHFATTGIQANFQSRPTPEGRWLNNVHLNVE